MPRSEQEGREDREGQRSIPFRPCRSSCSIPRFDCRLRALSDLAVQRAKYSASKLERPNLWPQKSAKGAKKAHKRPAASNRLACKRRVNRRRAGIFCAFCAFLRQLI